MLTVIIPVYNVEATLCRCVDSVVGQTYRDMEIILVNDGSPDACPKMCERYADKDRRIKVIHKENGGLSSARNAGLDVATGEYVTFVDSDDYVEKDTYNKVLQHFDEGTDIVEYPVWCFYGSSRQQLLAFNGERYCDKEGYWFDGKAYAHAYAWNKVYRRDVFRDVRFPVGRLFEDAYTLPMILEHTRNVVTVNVGLYYYCENKKGITSTANGEGLKQLFAAHIDRFAPITDEKYYLHVLNIQLDVCAMTGERPRLNRLKIKKAWRQGLKNGIKLSLLNIIGLDAMCRLYRIIYLLKR